MTTRQHIIDRLADGCREHPDIRCAWLGGADANNRADEISDVDICCYVTPGSEERVLDFLEQTLVGVAPIALGTRDFGNHPRGLRQALYQLADLGHAGLIDFCMFDDPDSGISRAFRVAEQHGTPPILFDPDGLYVPEPLDADKQADGVAKSIGYARTALPMLAPLATKAVLRNDPAAAAHFYQGLVFRPLVSLLRAIHCPERHDFTPRYLRDDLPPAVCDEVFAIALPSLDDIEPFTDRALALAREQLAEHEG